jgi:hypothetical protein
MAERGLATMARLSSAAIIRIPHDPYLFRCGPFLLTSLLAAQLEQKLCVSFFHPSSRAASTLSKTRASRPAIL